MSVILTLTSTGTGGGAITATTSGIAQADILRGALFANGALVVLLVLHYLLSEHDSWNASIMGALRAVAVPLVVTFCAFIVFTAVHT
jgi:hypothetical protein